MSILAAPSGSCRTHIDEWRRSDGIGMAENRVAIDLPVAVSKTEPSNNRYSTCGVLLICAVHTDINIGQAPRPGTCTWR
jgi:hypothetical protein